MHYIDRLRDYATPDDCFFRSVYCPMASVYVCISDSTVNPTLQLSLPAAFIAELLLYAWSVSYSYGRSRAVYL